MIETLQEETAEKEKLPKWLKRVQENSWEGEILISGGAIFSLFQISDFLAAEKVFFSENAPFIGLDELLIFSILAVEGVTFSFILHLFLRGLWIALLCVNAAFPKGVNHQKLRLPEQYVDAKDPTLTLQIVNLDNIAGLIFYTGFAYAMVVLGLLTTFMFLMPFALYLPGSQVALVVLLFVFFSDFIFGGPLRKNPKISKIYRPVYILYNVVTLAFLYRKPMQVVFSNVRRLNAVLFMLIFIPTTLILAYLSVYPVLHLPTPFDWRAHQGTRMNDGVLYTDRFYLDQISPNENIRWMAIQSDVVSGNYLKVFVTYRAQADEAMFENAAQSFDEIIHLKLDGDSLKIDWINSVRTHANQRGLIGMIPLRNVGSGKHLIELDIESEYYRRVPRMKIPFWKE
jgi:hypothetical protein